MTINDIFNNSKKFLKSNSPEILTGLGVAGVFATGYLSAVAGYKHAQKMSEEDPHMEFVEEAKLVWKIYIPPAMSGAAAMICIVGASKASARRTAVAVSAYSLTERAFSEYKEKVKEVVGDQKEEKIRAEISNDHIRANPPSKEVIIAGSGNVLCCELMTRRYFRSDMETLRKAQNDINAAILAELYVTLDEFYDLVGLSHTTHSSELGWDSNKMMELQFTTVLTEDGEPCLAFEYNYVKPLD